MSNMRRMDDGAGQPQWSTPEGVRESAPVCYPRKRRENWPFKFYEEQGRIYQNTRPRARKSELTDVEDAPW